MTGTIFFGFFVEKIEISNPQDAEKMQEVMITLRRVPQFSADGRKPIPVTVTPKMEGEDAEMMMKMVAPFMGIIQQSLTHSIEKKSQIVLAKKEFDDYLPKLRVGDVIDLQIMMRGDED